MKTLTTAWSAAKAAYRFVLPMCLLAAVAHGQQVLTRDQYMAAMNAGLDLVNSRLEGSRRFPMQFSGNLFFSHEVAIETTPLVVLQRYVDGLRSAGVHRVDINPGLWPWRAPAGEASAAAAIEKYDQIVQYIQGSGLRVVLNPQYSAGRYRFNSFQEWRAAATPVWVELARRYQPEIFIVVHEPGTMATRLGVPVSAREWRDAVQDMARQIKAVAPRTRLGAGGLPGEMEIHREFLALPELDTLTVNIYGLNPNDIEGVIEMITLAQTAGKAVYIAETWRPPHFVPTSGVTPTLESYIATGIGDAAFQQLDVKWLRTIATLASVAGVEAFTPFWTQTYFLYVQDADNGALDPMYNRRVAEAIAAGQRTATHAGVRQLSETLGVRHLTVNSGSFNGGTVAPDSIVTIFAYPGATLAPGTAAATSTTWPTTLGGVRVRFRDRAGNEADAPLYAVSPTQISGLVPPGMSNGTATVTVVNGASSFDGAVQIATVSPGIYTANQNGVGPAAAYATRIAPDGSQTSELAVAPDPANPSRFVPVPIDVGGPGDQVILSLFGTGWRRNGSLANVRVTIGGVDTEVLYAGAQPQYPGLDQLNVRIPRSLAGRGEVTVNVLVNNRVANGVTIAIR